MGWLALAGFVALVAVALCGARDGAHWRRWILIANAIGGVYLCWAAATVRREWTAHGTDASMTALSVVFVTFGVMGVVAWFSLRAPPADGSRQLGGLLCPIPAAVVAVGVVIFANSS